MAANPKILNQGQLIGPSIASGDWAPENVWDTGFVDVFSANLAYLSVEQCDRSVLRYYNLSNFWT